jgi:enoyl-[acyl-carrier protein] reductase/trans-2-enoyl-CoA reductase (NAD+)
LKPIGQSVTTKNLNTSKRIIDSVSVDAASEEEIQGTIDVMGGADWELWIKALGEAGVLANGFKTVAYTYIGKELTWPIYGHATIGRAKEDLDRASAAIKTTTANIKGEAYVTSLNAVVTQASSAIPIMPLYISAMFKVMKADGTYEGCIEQIQALFRENIYGKNPTIDEAGRLRQNNKELEDSVQQRVTDIWNTVDSDTIDELTDYVGYHQEFLKLFGFDVAGVDYDADISPELAINNLL